MPPLIPAVVIHSLTRRPSQAGPASLDSSGSQPFSQCQSGLESPVLYQIPAVRCRDIYTRQHSAAHRPGPKKQTPDIKDYHS